MIIQDDTAFPGNVILAVANQLATIDPDVPVFKRKLRPTDSNQAIGIYALRWEPNPSSYEMRGGGDPGPNEPSLVRYYFGVQSFVQDTEEERGLAVHSVLAKLVRDMLYRSTAIRVGLAGLTSSTLGGVTERTTRWGIESQQMMSNEIQGSWLYLSTLGFWLETQTR